jgi:hypothetical protein
VRSSEDYEQGRESAEDSLTKVDENEAKQACAASAALTK